MTEREERISHYTNDVVRQLNDKYPGIVTEDSVKTFLSNLFSSSHNEEEMMGIIDSMVEKTVVNYKERMALQEAVKSELHYDLNDMFDCRITGNTLHIHVVPKSVKEEMTRLGIKKYLEVTGGKLEEAFGMIADIISREEHANISSVFAVSPLLRITAVQGLFKKYDFDTKMTTNETFIKMFKTKKVGEAIISRERFLNMVADRNLGVSGREEKDTSNELSSMFNDSSKKDGVHIQEYGEKSDSKVFVKNNNPVVSSNSESGYGSVLGVILVIVSISFIITALFIALLS